MLKQQALILNLALMKYSEGAGHQQRIVTGYRTTRVEERTNVY